jgi:hypothetical protein
MNMQEPAASAKKSRRRSSTTARRSTRASHKSPTNIYMGPVHSKEASVLKAVSHGWFMQ